MNGNEIIAKNTRQNWTSECNIVVMQSNGEWIRGNITHFCTFGIKWFIKWHNGHILPIAMSAQVSILRSFVSLCLSYMENIWIGEELNEYKRTNKTDQNRATLSAESFIHNGFMVKVRNKAMSPSPSMLVVPMCFLKCPRVTPKQHHHHRCHQQHHHNYHHHN